MNESAIVRLEAWKSGHKARAVEISQGNGYGADCWEVNLSHEHGKTFAYEVAFFLTTADEAKAKGVVFGVGDPAAWEESEDETWPGLEKTIHAAIDAYDAGIWLTKEREAELNQERLTEIEASK